MYPTQNFTMPIDHFHNESRYEPHTNGTFVNHYWLDTSNYVEGGPVIVNALGEDNYNFDLGWLQKGLLHELANATGGVAVLWGQRYYSGSYDIVPNYTTANLRFHTTEQALADLAYFATRVKFSGLEDKNLTAPSTPWFIIGGSYAGVISAFARIQYPDVFWVRHSLLVVLERVNHNLRAVYPLRESLLHSTISGVSHQSKGRLRVVTDKLLEFYDVVRRYGQPACIEAQQKLIDIADKILTSGNKTQITKFKTAFGAPILTSNHEFANLLSSPMGSWQGHEWVPGQNYPFAGKGSPAAQTIPNRFS
jgi:hypothetical protein